MPTTTPQFGWQVPVSTDLVKDGAVAIETLGDAIDARFGNLATYPNQIVNVVSGVSRPIPYATNAGTATITFGATAGASISVTFAASRFTQAPLVFGTITGNASGTAATMILRTHTTTTSGTTLLGTLTASATTAVTVNWQAIQMTSAASAG
jgi:hypothetical protein